MRKPVLFVDFDGTICFDKFWSSDGEIFNFIQSYLFIDNKEIVDEWMRGNYTSEEINRMVATEGKFDYQRVWNVFVGDCKGMTVSAEIFSLLSQLRAQYTVVLVTGNMDCFDRFTVPALNFNHYFDRIINSYNEGQLKTENDGETFKKTSSDLSDCILIEDSEKSCNVFEDNGGRAMQVKTPRDTLNCLESLLI